MIGNLSVSMPIHFQSMQNLHKTEVLGMTCTYSSCSIVHLVSKLTMNIPYSSFFNCQNRCSSANWLSSKQHVYHHYHQIHHLLPQGLYVCIGNNIFLCKTLIFSSGTGIYGLYLKNRLIIPLTKNKMRSIFPSIYNFVISRWGFCMHQNQIIWL